MFYKNFQIVYKPESNTYAIVDTQYNQEIKCSSVQVGDEPTERDVYKQPITDSGKKSKSGRLKLVRENGDMITVASKDPRIDMLQTVFKDGQTVISQNFSDIRSRAV